MMKTLFLTLVIVFGFLSPLLAQGDELDSLTAIFEDLSEKEKPVWLAQNVLKHSGIFSRAATLPLHKEGIRLAKSQGQEFEAALLARWAGIAAYYAGDLEASLAYQQDSFSGFEALGDKKEMGRTLTELGLTYGRSGSPLKGAEVLKRAYKYCSEAGDSLYMSNALDNLGMRYQRLGYPDSAQDCYRKVLNIRLNIKDSIGLGYIYTNLASVKYDFKDFDSMLYFLEKAKEVRLKVGDTRNVITNTSDIGETYAALGEPKKAITYFERSLRMLDSSGIKYRAFRVHLYTQMSLAYQKAGYYDKAYQKLK
ncbi:MAG: tetratricopeptide repeat protein, partial [Bacteroidota bacterium]